MTKQAQNAGKQMKKGTHVAKDKKVWTKVTFRRPKTLQMKRNAKVLPHSYEKKATKPQIKKACEDLYSIKVRKVNTMITCRGEKKAYVMLKKEFDALEVANKIGIM